MFYLKKESLRAVTVLIIVKKMLFYFMKLPLQEVAIVFYPKKVSSRALAVSIFSIEEICYASPFTRRVWIE